MTRQNRLAGFSGSLLLSAGLVVLLALTFAIYVRSEKQVDRANFKTIDLAWEAHRARNRIAHTQGGGIDTHEARRVIGLYTQIFKEFDF